MIAIILYRDRWRVPYLIMMSTMLVDLDHLLADPVYDPTRCSINFHPLHSFIPIMIYLLLCVFPVTRLPGFGLTIHMALDSLDCYFNQGVWYAS